MNKHYIACAGLLGYMTNYCQYHESYDNAVEDLVVLHELGKNRARELKRDGYLELNLQRDGNEYCEVIECECDNPEEHSD